MAYSQGKTQKEYYQGRDHGSYQFVSLEDIINQFLAVYVGRDKIIPRANRADVVYHAQRALSELSFDTFKSVKSQQIDIPSSLTMILPHDYVNYTKISWADDAGIKHPIYPTKHTSNPFQVRQEEDGFYDFPENYELVINGDFDDNLSDPWFHSPFSLSTPRQTGITAGTDITVDADNKLSFNHSSHGAFGQPHGKAQACWQAIDVSEIDYLDISAAATSFASSTVTWNLSTAAPHWPGANVAADGQVDTSDFHPLYTTAISNYNTTVVAGSADTSQLDFTSNIPETTIRFGISSTPGSDDIAIVQGLAAHPNYSPNFLPDIFDVGYVEWTAGEVGTKELYALDVRNLTTAYVLITSSIPFEEHAYVGKLEVISAKNTIDDISVKNTYSSSTLQSAIGATERSSTWNNFKSANPNENAQNEFGYDDHRYDLNLGRRYGLDPTLAQVNGSFYIDELRGKIHFSSNISGKTVILDYISDSLGTEEEMKVHKFAVDAMYKHILYDITYSRVDVSGGMLSLLRKDKFAAVRKAKIRLSNFKLEELTQILRGKSKHIKH